MKGREGSRRRQRLIINFRIQPTIRVRKGCTRRYADGLRTRSAASINILKDLPPCRFDLDLMHAHKLQDENFKTSNLTVRGQRTAVAAPGSTDAPPTANGRLGSRLKTKTTGTFRWCQLRVKDNSCVCHRLEFSSSKVGRTQTRLLRNRRRVVSRKNEAHTISIYLYLCPKYKSSYFQTGLMSDRNISALVKQAAESEIE